MQEGYTTCYNCGGTGKVEIGGAWIVCFRTATEIITCPVCHGTGEILQEVYQEWQKEFIKVMEQIASERSVATVIFTVAIITIASWFVLRLIF